MNECYEIAGPCGIDRVRCELLDKDATHYLDMLERNGIADSVVLPHIVRQYCDNRRAYSVKRIRTT